MKKTVYILIALLIIGTVSFIIFAPSKPGKYDTFAQCIKNSGATFYGAFWCPHCQSQKAKFGASAKLLPYVECSTPDGQGQTQACKDAGVETYPTWKFAGGVVTTGDLDFSVLASSTGCVLPQ